MCRRTIYQFVFFLSLASVSIGVHDVFAEDELPDNGIQISPLRFDWTINAGETRTDEIIVHNFSDTSHEIEVGVEDFYVSHDSLQATFYVPDDTHELKAYDVIDWIALSENSITLAPHETKTLHFRITVPENQPTNGYYGAIFFKTRAEDVAAESASGRAVTLGVHYRVGALITLAVQGREEMRIDGALEDFFVSQKIFLDEPITLQTQLRSEGNVHYQAHGRIDVYKFGKKFTTVMIAPEVLYPGKNRTFVKNIPFTQFDHGVYSAKLEMQSEDSSVVFDGEIPFFVVIPWQSTLAIVGSAFFVIMAVIFFKRKYKIVKIDDLEIKE
jgi:hypothetical protein